MHVHVNTHVILLYTHNHLSLPPSLSPALSNVYIYITLSLSLSASLSLSFSLSLSLSLTNTHTQQFIPVGVFKLSERGGALINIEPMLEGEYVKHNDNDGHVDTTDMYPQVLLFWGFFFWHSFLGTS